MKIIKANIDWVNQTAVLFNEYRKFYNQEDDIEESTQFIKDRITNNEATIFLALNDDKEAIGFTQIYPTFSSVSCKKDYILNDLYVHPKYRKTGVATLLLEMAKTFSVTQGGKGLSLETAKNNPARRLYEKLGWHLENDFIHYYWKASYNPLVELKFINKEIGFGVFAVSNIEKGEKIVTGKSIYKTTIRDHKTLQISDTEHSRLDVPFENTNHSCDPNAGVKENEFDGYNLIAIKNIKKGDEITMDYCMTEWESTLGTCLCGTEGCRKNITGAKETPKEILAGYDGFISSYIKKKLSF